jgi:hypothetical protein
MPEERVMKKILFGYQLGRSTLQAKHYHWFAQRKRYLLFVPRQNVAPQNPRPSGIFGVLVSPYQ